jgi:predicted GNAT family N-acyltransferase
MIVLCSKRGTEVAPERLLEGVAEAGQVGVVVVDRQARLGGPDVHEARPRFVRLQLLAVGQHQLDVGVELPQKLPLKNVYQYGFFKNAKNRFSECNNFTNI